MATLFSKFADTKILIELEQFQFPESKDSSDKEWIIGNLRFGNAYFKAEIINQPQFYFGQLKRLIQDLEKTLKTTKGIVEYSGIEPYLTLKISLKDTGVANIEGMIWDVDHNWGRLSFTFESDQTCLKSFIQELEKDLSLL